MSVTYAESFLDVLHVAPTTAFNVRGYGALGDGVSDDTAFIQAAIDACQTANGGVVFFPAGRYKTTATLNVRDNCVHLQGAGAAFSTDVGDYTTMGGAMIVWKGASAGTVLSVEPTTGASATALLGFKLTDLTVEGYGAGATMAAIGIQLRSCRGFFLQNFFIMNCSTAGLDMTALAAGSLGEAHDTTRGYVGRGSVRALDGSANGAICIRLDGNATGAANTCCNHFEMLQLSHRGTSGNPAIELLNCDNNAFVSCYVNRFDGTNPGIRLNGSNTAADRVARNNYFVHCSAGDGGLIARATGLTHAATPNFAERYQRGNGEPAATVESGATFTYTTNP